MIKKYNWLALAFFICCMYLWVSLFFRKENEQCMKDRNIDILVIQESRTKCNQRESRKEYTWFFSGENGRPEYTAGLAIVIKNDYLKYVQDIEPIDDRLMILTLKGIMPITIINTYIPQAERPEEER